MTDNQKNFDWLAALAVAGLAGTFVRAIWFTPLEAAQGAAQKIMYVHVPSAWVAFMAFFFTAIAAIVYLFVRDERLDRFSAASAEVGLMFTTLVLVTGPLWGKPVWGTYWQWEMRLTLTLLLWFLYVGYVVLRGAIDDRELRARYSAVLAALGALLIPFIHLSVYIWRTMHPLPFILNPDGPKLPGVMLVTLLIGVVAFTVLYAAFVRSRYRLAVLQDRVGLEALA